MSAQWPKRGEIPVAKTDLEAEWPSDFYVMKAHAEFAFSSPAVQLAKNGDEVTEVQLRSRWQAREMQRQEVHRAAHGRHYRRRLFD